MIKMIMCVPWQLLYMLQWNLIKTNNVMHISDVVLQGFGGSTSSISLTCGNTCCHCLLSTWQSM